MNIKSFPFTRNLSERFIEELTQKHDIVSFEKGSPIVKQYESGEFFYFLLEGEIEFSIKVDHEHEELSVGKRDKSFTPVGWSGFREPYRYATTVACVENATLIRWSHEDLGRMIHEDPESGKHFLRFIFGESMNMLQITREMLTEIADDSDTGFLNMDTFYEMSKDYRKKGLDILKRSPFFEVFKPSELRKFAEMGIEQEFKRGEKVYRQGDVSQSMDVLIDGKIALIYARDINGLKLDKRIISSEGYIIGNGAFNENGLNQVSCVALNNSTILRIDANLLDRYLETDPTLAVNFYLRLLWFISNRLRAARAKLISIQYDGEILAVKNLIEQNCTQLSISSELHKIPHLLGHTYTLEDGISKLDMVKENGTTLERTLASASLEILSEVVREHDFYQGLASIYHHVVNAPRTMSHFEVRELCAQKFIEVFDKTHFILEGTEHLPDDPSVFIYNHLKNHVYNTFPNNFQLTLDSHFISSVILYKKYKNPGIRVVRVPKSDEYGHQYYYERLGHIPVYTEDSVLVPVSKEEKQIRRESFYKTASNYLQEGSSIMLAPEGQSRSTNESPGAFRMGAFRLPTYMKKEPFIVPIVMANFDKRLNHTNFVAVIKKPFKISERVENPDSKAEMIAFLNEYQKEYKTYVEEAVDLSRGSGWMKLVEEVN